MKKKLSLILILCLCITLTAGCGKSKSKKSADANLTSKNSLSFDPDKYVTLGDYKGLDSYKVSYDATDDEVQEQIDSDLNDQAEYTDITDRGAQNGDYIMFDYSAAIDGKKIDDCSETDYEIQLGMDDFNETIEKEMLDKKPGDTFTVKTKVTEDLNEEHAGEKADFTIKVTQLQEEHLPTLDEAFVKKNTEFKTVEEYKENAKKEVIKSKSDDTYDTLVSDLLSEGVNNAKYKSDYPKDLYSTCKDDINEQIDTYTQEYSISREDCMQLFFGIEKESDIDELVKQEVNQRLFIYALAKKEALFPTDKAYKNYLKQLCDEYGYDSSEDIENECGKDMLMYQLIYDNVGKFLYDNAKKKDISGEDYDAMNAEQSDEETDEEATESNDDATSEEDTDNNSESDSTTESK